MAEPTNELMMKILLEIREDVGDIRRKLDAIDAKIDCLTERFNILTLRVDVRFADLRVAVR